MLDTPTLPTALRTVPPFHPRADPQGTPTYPPTARIWGRVPSHSPKDRHGPPAASGRLAPALAGTTSARSPWGSHTARVKLPRKAKRWPLSAATRTQSAPSQARSRRGEGSVAVESQGRPRDPPPALPSSRPRPHLPLPAQSRPEARGQACRAASWTGRDPGLATRGSGRAGHPSRGTLVSRPGREGRAFLLALQGAGSGSLRRRGPRPFHSRVPHAAWPATSGVATSAWARLGRPARAQTDTRESGSCRRPAEAHTRCLPSGPLIPQRPVLAHLRKVVTRRGGGGGGGGGAGTPQALGPPRLASRRGRAHAPAPAPVREDGRFCLSIKALCCAHTKPPRPAFPGASEERGCMNKRP